MKISSENKENHVELSKYIRPKRSTSPARSRRLVTVLTGLSAAALILSGCATGGGTATPADTSGAKTPDSSSTFSQDQATARDSLKKVEAVPDFVANAQFDMAKTVGKSVLVLLSSSAVPFVASIGDGIKAAAQKVGWHVTIVDGKGSVTEWSKVVHQAISQKVDGVITVGASPAEFKPATAALKKAGIPMVDTLTADQDRDPLIDGDFSHVSISFYDSGRYQADYVIAHGTPDAHVLIFGDNEFPGEVTRVEGMKAEFSKLCSGCEVTVIDTQVGSLATNMQSLTQSALRRDPKIEWVLPTYDGQGTYIVPAIKAAGLASKVKVVGTDAVASNLKFVKAGDVQVADVGEPAEWSGWAAVDMLGRAFTGEKPVAPNIPLRMFTQENLQNVDVNDEDQLFGSAFRDGYLKVWGLDG